jgi:hypothetical protein
VTPEAEEDFPDVVNATLGVSTRSGISVSRYHSFDCLENVERTTAVSLPSAVCTGLVTTELPFTSGSYTSMVQILAYLPL